MQAAGLVKVDEVDQRTSRRAHAGARHLDGLRPLPASDRQRTRYSKVI